MQPVNYFSEFHVGIETLKKLKKNIYEQKNNTRRFKIHYNMLKNT